jgi:predicted PurR-regulated permease PerM
MSDQEPTPKRQFFRLSRGFYLFFLVAVSIIVFFMARQFLMPIILSAISAGIYWPLHQRVARLITRPVIAALVSTIVIFLIVLIPLGAIGYFTVVRLLDFAGYMTHNTEIIISFFDELSGLLDRIPFVGTINIREMLTGSRLLRFIQDVGAWILDKIGSGSENIVLIPLQIFIYLYTLYFFLKEGDSIAGRIIGLLPLQQRYQSMLADRFISVTRAILKSTFVIGVIQGTIGGVAVFLLGLPAAILAGVLLLFLAIIPDIGAVFVWLPASVVLFVRGEYIGGVIMILVGLGIAVVGYILRPRLIGDDIQIHQILVLIGVLGGIAVFGIFGFILGPILISLFVILWQMFREAMFEQHTE